MVDKRAEARRKKQTGPPKQQSWFAPILALVVVVGVLGTGAAVFFTKGSDPAPSGPAAGDHWHIAYGVYDCDKYLPASQEQNDPLGIHTHGDGLIHVHPYDVSVIGDGARLARFTDAIGSELTDDHYRPGAGEAGAPELTAGQGCGDKPSELVVAYWPDALKDAKPELVTKDLADFHFTRDGSAVAIALVPQGTTEIPLPPVIEQLQNPSDT